MRERVSVVKFIYTLEALAMLGHCLQSLQVAIANAFHHVRDAAFSLSKVLFKLFCIEYYAAICTACDVLYAVCVV